MAQNLFANAGVAVASTTGTKRRAVAPGAGGEQENEMALVTAKLSLSSALKARILVSATLDCYKVETNDPIAAAIRSGVKLFVDTAKSMRENRIDGDEIQAKIGVSDGAAFNEVVKVVIESVKATDEPLAKRIQETANAWTPAYLMGAVRLLRIDKAFDSKFKKVYVRLAPGAPVEGAMDAVEVWTVVEKELLSRTKNRIMRGVAPPGDLERRLQSMIDSMEGKEDKA